LGSRATTGALPQVEAGWYPPGTDFSSFTEP